MVDSTEKQYVCPECGCSTHPCTYHPDCYTCKMADDDRDECRHENSCSCVKAREELQRRYDAVVAERDKAREALGTGWQDWVIRAEKAEALAESWKKQYDVEVYESSEQTMRALQAEAELDEVKDDRLDIYMRANESVDNAERARHEAEVEQVRLMKSFDLQRRNHSLAVRRAEKAEAALEVAYSWGTPPEHTGHASLEEFVKDALKETDD